MADHRGVTTSGSQVKRSTKQRGVLPGFEHVCLEDSWVLGIDVSGEAVRVRLDTALLPGHPDYAAPARRERHCYREGVILFERLRRCSGDVGFLSSRDAGAEPDLGRLTGLTKKGDLWRLEGDWGRLSIVSDAPVIVVAAAGVTGTRSSGGAGQGASERAAPERAPKRAPSDEPVSDAVVDAAPAQDAAPQDAPKSATKKPVPVSCAPSFGDPGERCECVRQLIDALPEGVVVFGTGVDESWIVQAEHDLGFALPQSFKWWLRLYGSGTIREHDVFGLAGEHVDEVNPSRVIRSVRRQDLSSGLQPEHLLTFFSPALEGVFAFDLTQRDREGEYPVVSRNLNWARYADDFLDFLEKYLRPLVD